MGLLKEAPCGHSQAQVTGAPFSGECSKLLAWHQAPLTHALPTLVFHPIPGALVTALGHMPHTPCSSHDRLPLQGPLHSRPYPLRLLDPLSPLEVSALSSHTHHILPCFVLN